MSEEYNIVKKRFGKLVVLERASNRNTRQSWWLCECDCGKKKEIRGIKLVNEITRSCGCLKRTQIPYNYLGCNDLSGKHWNSIKRHAKERNLEVNLTIEEAWNKFEKQNKKCALSGVDITLTRNNKQQTASLDRIDSKKDYSTDNIQWVHKDINMMKRDLNNNDFITYCKKIAEYSNSAIFFS